MIKSFQLFLLGIFSNVSYLRNLCLTQSHKDSLLCSYLEFLVLDFTFESLIHLKLSLWCKMWVKITVFAYGCLIVPASFVKKTTFALLDCLSSFFKDHLPILISVYFWAFYFVQLYLSILLPIPHSVDYCSFIVSLEIK